MKVIILGPVGAGKGSYSKALAKEYNFKHLSTGDLLRKEIEKNSDLGKEIKEKIDAGVFIPDNLMLDLLKEQIKGDCILDGFPRNLNQGKMLDRVVKIDKVVFLDISDKVVIERLGSREICKECGKIYGLKVPSKNGKCECGGSLYQRDDDKPEIVKSRLETYHRLTEPLVEYYNKKGLLVKIDAIGKFDVVLSRIKKALKLK